MKRFGISFNVFVFLFANRLLRLRLLKLPRPVVPTSSSSTTRRSASRWYSGIIISATGSCSRCADRIPTICKNDEAEFWWFIINSNLLGSNKIRKKYWRLWCALLFRKPNNYPQWSDLHVLGRGFVVIRTCFITRKDLQASCLEGFELRKQSRRNLCFTQMVSNGIVANLLMHKLRINRWQKLQACVTKSVVQFWRIMHHFLYWPCQNGTFGSFWKMFGFLTTFETIVEFEHSFQIIWTIFVHRFHESCSSDSINSPRLIGLWLHPQLFFFLHILYNSSLWELFVSSVPSSLWPRSEVDLSWILSFCIMSYKFCFGIDQG